MGERRPGCAGSRYPLQHPQNKKRPFMLTRKKSAKQKRAQIDFLTILCYNDTGKSENENGGKEKMLVKKSGGAAIRSAMRERGETQVTLSEKLGMLQSALSMNICRRRMSLSNLYKILDKMDYDIVVVDRRSGETKWAIEESDE